MKELIKRFNRFQEEHPALGSVVVLSMSVENQNYSKELIQRAFNKLVSKEEYDASEKREIIASLTIYSQKSVL